MNNFTTVQELSRAAENT